MPTLLATSNQGKLKEVLEIVGNRVGKLLLLSDFPHIGELPEEQDTFEGNALQKARTAAELLQMPVIADDSGLAVDFLGGAPGVYSARYAGQHGNNAANRAKLLDAMKNVPPAQRGAKFVCVMVLVDPIQNIELVARGECHGEIALIEKGQHGFGYDPLFLLPEKNLTMAEISSEEKNKISHRGKAIEELLQKILAIGWKPA